MKLLSSKLVIIIFLLALTTSPAAAQLEQPDLEFKESGISLKVNEDKWFTVSAENNLNEDDNLTLQYSVDSTLVGVSVQELTIGTDQMSCTSGSCRVPMGGGNSLEIPFRLTGRSGGQGDLTFRLKSQTTGLTDKEIIKISVSSGDIGHAAPDLNTNYLVLLLVIGAGLYAMLLTTDEDSAEN